MTVNAGLTRFALQRGGSQLIHTVGGDYSIHSRLKLSRFRKARCFALSGRYRPPRRNLFIIATRSAEVNPGPKSFQRFSSSGCRAPNSNWQRAILYLRSYSMSTAPVRLFATSFEHREDVARHATHIARADLGALMSSNTDPSNDNRHARALAGLAILSPDFGAGPPDPQFCGRLRCWGWS